MARPTRCGSTWSTTPARGCCWPAPLPDPVGRVLPLVGPSPHLCTRQGTGARAPGRGRAPFDRPNRGNRPDPGRPCRQHRTTTTTTGPKETNQQAAVRNTHEAGPPASVAGIGPDLVAAVATLTDDARPMVVIVLADATEHVTRHLSQWLGQSAGAGG